MQRQLSRGALSQGSSGGCVAALPPLAPPKNAQAGCHRLPWLMHTHPHTCVRPSTGGRCRGTAGRCLAGRARPGSHRPPCAAARRRLRGNQEGGGGGVSEEGRCWAGDCPHLQRGGQRPLPPPAPHPSARRSRGRAGCRCRPQSAGSRAPGGAGPSRGPRGRAAWAPRAPPPPPPGGARRGRGGPRVAAPRPGRCCCCVACRGGPVAGWEGREGLRGAGWGCLGTARQLQAACAPCHQLPDCNAAPWRRSGGPAGPQPPGL